MNGAPVRQTFATRAELAAGLADVVAMRLSSAIAARGTGLLAVSGGTTPALFFETLSSQDIDWSKVVVTLVDERLVPESSPRSNAGLVFARLLQKKAAQARFVGLAPVAGLPNATTRNAAAEAAASADISLRQLSLPLDVVVLGMGGDGHTASFFPDADDLEQLLDPATTDIVSVVHAASAGEPRLTLTLPPIAGAGFIALHIEGAEKAATLDVAMAPGANLPIRRVIDAALTPVAIFWAP